MVNDLEIVDDTDEEKGMAVVEMTTVAQMNKSEVEAQLDAAHKYRRSLTRFQQRALSMATITPEVAASCMYSLPRSGKAITGPSVRLAEICASAWGNIHVGARPMEVGDTEVTSQGVAWDLETNFRVTVESKRKITDRNGKRYNEDMIIMTQNAANSIALRNAIFRVIPRAYVDQVYERAKRVAIGDASTLTAKRDEVLTKLYKMGADQTRVLAAIGKAAVGDIGLEELEVLIGFGTAIKDGSSTVDKCFPEVKQAQEVKPEQEGKRLPLGKSKTVKVEMADGSPVPPAEPGSDG